ncbi:ABC-type branched-subunit amino acid transport system permease subunit [Microbacterium foliorum]|uniref:ABC-type branched-subunit amino acid transport system permease subunit n=2 Tax=Microbacterium foliorum TaxID=104336 RepID=A0ABU1HVJ6_9MICO|nr:ABC-type branched-subunit amino acid transport system permease subunit [Microbacterium foliorum]
MVSVGQQASSGLGADGVVVFNDLGIDACLSAVIVSLVVAGIAFPISFLAFRSRGGYFAIGTWVIAKVERQIAIRFDLLGLGRGRSFSSITPDPVFRDLYTYWLALALMVFFTALTYQLLRGRQGLAPQSIRDNEVTARSLGVEIDKSKRFVFVIAAGGAAAAGALICIQALGVASPHVIFSVN